MKYKFTFILFGLMVLVGVGYSLLSSPGINQSGDSITEIKADEIQKILEMNGASEQVHVRFDTTYTSIQYRVNILGLKMSAYEALNKLSQIVHYEIKAGCTEFKIVGSELFIESPTLTSVEELTSDREILIHEGEWSPVAMKSISIKTKSLAQSAALEKGIIEACKLNIEEAFASFKMQVSWIQ